MNTPIKQYIRFFLVKIGLFNKGAFLLAINRLHKDDIFIVSYPKSGNTWLRFLIANMLDNKNTITFNNIDNYVHGIHSAKDIINKKTSKRFIKSHYPFFEYYPKTVYIYRDYRDVLISFYHYQIALQEFKGTFSKFIRSKKNIETPYGSWKEHVSKAFEHKKNKPSSILIIKYEDLHLHPEKFVTEIATFCNIKISQPIDVIIEKCSFNSLKKNENTYGSEFQKQSGQNFFREGKTFEWKKNFSEDDMKWLLETDNNISALQLTGYPIL